MNIHVCGLQSEVMYSAKQPLITKIVIVYIKCYALVLNHNPLFSSLRLLKS